MAFNDSNFSDSQSFSSRISRLSETENGGSVRFQSSTSTVCVKTEPDDVKPEPLPLDSRLIKAGLSGYRRSSVEAYVDELKSSANRLRDSMGRQIQSLSSECTRLKSESRVLRGQLVQAEEQNNQVRSLLEAVTSQRDAAENRVSLTEAELKNMEEKFNLYETEKAGAEALQCSLREKSSEIACLEDENERLRSQISEFSEKIDIINEEVSRYRDRKAAEQAESAELKRQLVSLLEENSALKSELDAARQELNVRSQQSSDCEQPRFPRDSTELLEAFFKYLTDRTIASAAADGTAQEKQSVTVAQEEGREREADNTAVRRDKPCRRSAVEDLQDVINDLIAEVQHQQEMYDRLSEERSENKGLIYNLTRDRSELHMQNADLQAQNGELFYRNEDLSRQVSKLEEENTRLSMLLTDSDRASGASEDYDPPKIKNVVNMRSYGR